MYNLYIAGRNLSSGRPVNICLGGSLQLVGFKVFHVHLKLHWSCMCIKINQHYSTYFFLIKQAILNVAQCIDSSVSVWINRFCVFVWVRFLNVEKLLSRARITAHLQQTTLIKANTPTPTHLSVSSDLVRTHELNINQNNRDICPVFFKVNTLKVLISASTTVVI